MARGVDYIGNHPYSPFFSKREAGEVGGKKDVTVAAVGEVPGGQESRLRQGKLPVERKGPGRENRRKKEKSREDFDPGRRYTILSF